MLTLQNALREETSSVIPHNKKPEFVFGVLDCLVKFRPNATTLTNEAYIMYSYNKTAGWLESLDARKRRQYIEEARREGSQIKAKFKARIKTIEQQQRISLKAHRQFPKPTSHHQ